MTDYVKEIFILKDGGIPILTYPKSEMSNELVAMFCSAISTFGNEKFKSRIDYIHFREGQTILFREYVIFNQPFSIFVILDERNGHRNYDGLIIQLKWIVEKHGLFQKHCLSDSEYSRIREEITTVVKKS